jgi:molybdenum cofactor biosynthesis enzyme MoaA
MRFSRSKRHRTTTYPHVTPLPQVPNTTSAGRIEPMQRPSERRVVHRIGSTPENYSDEVYWNASVVAFDGAEYVISRRAILTLVTIAGCNAACKFCSNEITFTTKGPYLTHGARLERVTQLALLAGIRKIAYTGGEPTVSPQRLYNLVASTARRFSKARLHTNGLGLLNPVPTDEGEQILLDALIGVGLTGASISVAHFDPDVNNSIMRFKTVRRGLDEQALMQIGSRASTKPFSARLSCVLSPDGIKDLDDILAYVAWGRRLGFRKFIFRSPSGIPDMYAKPTEYSRYNAETHISIDPITEALGAKRRWVETFSQHKTDSHVHTYRVEDEVLVDIDESSEEADPDAKIRRLNVMPTGIVYTSWIDPYSYLFDDDRERAELDGRRELPSLALDVNR